MSNLEILEDNLRKLVAEHAQLRKENGQLIEDNRRQHNQLMEAHAEIVKLRHDVRDLETANAILREKKPYSSEKAKVYLTQLIGQVDSAMEALKQV